MLNLDTRFESYLIDGDGNKVLDQDKNPIRTAVDLFSGQAFKKIVESVSDRDPKLLGLKQESLKESGALHFASDVPGFTGYWAPVNA